MFDWLVGHPWHIALVGAVFLLAALLMLAWGGRPAQPWGWTPLAAALAWLAFAGWEALIQSTSPEANIRVDLVLIVPVVAILSLVALISLLMGVRVRLS